MDEPIWVNLVVVHAVHTNQLQEHGGRQGTRDEHALAAALARAQHKLAYEPDADIAHLAAAYAYALATSHPFVDGNKRTAVVVAFIFLELNGYDVDRSERDVEVTIRAVADHRMSETELAAWIRHALVPLSPDVDAAPSVAET
jgi:death on curing protein